MMCKIALLIVDMQSGNFSGDNPIFRGEELLKNVKSLVAKAHSSDIPIIYVQNNGGQGDPDELGTQGWEIHPSITPRKQDVVIQKGTPDAFHETGLNQKLKAKGVKELVIAGLQTEYCIDKSCRRAFSLGYNVTLVRDAHSTWDSKTLTAQHIIDHHNTVLSGFFVTLKREEEIKF